MAKNDKKETRKTLSMGDVALFGEPLPHVYEMIRRIVKDELIEVLRNSGISVEVSSIEKTFTRQEVMKRYDLSESTLWHLEKAGKLKPFRIGRKVFFREHDLKVLEGNKTTT